MASKNGPSRPPATRARHRATPEVYRLEFVGRQRCPNGKWTKTKAIRDELALLYVQGRKEVAPLLNYVKAAIALGDKGSVFTEYAYRAFKDNGRILSQAEVTFAAQTGEVNHFYDSLKPRSDGTVKVEPKVYCKDHKRLRKAARRARKRAERGETEAERHKRIGDQVRAEAEAARKRRAEEAKRLRAEIAQRKAEKALLAKFKAMVKEG